MSALPGKPQETLFYDPQRELESKRRRRYAENLQKMGQQPQGTEVINGMAVVQSPLAGLARALTQGLGNYEERKADEADVATQRKRQEMLAAAVSKLGTDPQAAASILVQDPATAELGFKTYGDATNRDFELKKQQAMLDALAPQRNLQLQAGQFELDQMRDQADRRNRWASAMGLGGPMPVQEMAQQAPGAIGPMAGPGGQTNVPANAPVAPPLMPGQYAQAAPQQTGQIPPEVMNEMIIRDPENAARILTAQRLAKGSGVGGATGALADRLIEQGVDPLSALLIAKSGLGSGNTMQGGQVAPMAGMTDTLQARNAAEALGKAQGESQGMIDKNAKQASTATDLIGEARNLIQKGSGSYPGAIGTAVSSGLGFSTESSQANAALRALGGRLTSMMPRMEGPQSNFDVQLYREMAGNIADPKVPAGDKEAALNVIESLNQKYQAMASTGKAQPDGPQAGMVEGGYRFKGGDPANPSNWEPVQ